MFKSILLCTDGSPAADVAAEYAVWFATQLHGRLRALYVTDIRILEGPLLSDVSGALGAQPYPALLPQLQQIQVEKAQTILGATAKRARDAGVACDTAHETGMMTDIVLDQERGADLVVLGQRGEHAQWSGDSLGSSVERLVRASVKPCLVTPRDFRPVKKILLAYDGSGESAKALSAGFDLGAALGAELVLVTVAPMDSADAAAKLLRAAHQQAQTRKLNVTTELAHGHAEAEILHLSYKTGADLIVMGAYGHTRIRELMLGSTTAQVMRKAHIPVLLARGPMPVP
jgi:nucleotide-binding universal stress UspA family protein